ncbi:MAG: hypothetical protein BWX66_00801 [Deltaproteobacteria bacterium ADurb.Bin058]|nr:MAG: hypothetical protein BWX66_00801 [Deltaproteobacteria bacterium ADurb.Bin058]
MDNYVKSCGNTPVHSIAISDVNLIVSDFVYSIFVIEAKLVQGRDFMSRL